MSKRKTTGLPKRKKKEQVQQEGAEDGSLLSNLIGGQYENRAERESQIQRLVMYGIGGLVGLLLILILAGILWESVIVPRQAVAVVNGDTITVSEFQDRVRLERLIINQRLYNDIPFLLNLGIIQDPNQILQQEPYSTQFQEISSQPELLGSRVLDDMIDEQIIRNKAEELGISYDEAAVDERIEQFFNFIEVTEEPTEEATEDGEEPTNTPTPFVSPTPSSTPSPTAEPSATPTPLPATEEVSGTEEAESDFEPTTTPRPTETPTGTPSNEEREETFNQQVNRFYQEGSREADLNRQTVRSFFEFQALLEALQEEVTSDVDRMAPYVNARHILVETEEQAQQVITALEEGESFADLARAVSTDTGSGARGGELGWSPASNYVPEFRDAAIDGEIGEILGPIESEFGYHIIQVRAREEREMSDSEFDRAKNAAFNEWLEEVTAEENNEIEKRDNWPAYVPSNPFFDPLRVVDPATATPQ